MRKIILAILLILNYSCLSSSALMEYNENDNSQTFDGQSFFESVNTGALTVIGPVNLNASQFNLGPAVQVQNAGVNQGDVLSVDAAGNLKFMAPTGGSGATPGAGTVTSNTIAPGAVTSAAIGDDQVLRNHIKDGEVLNPELADNAVNARTLEDNAVTDSKVAAGVIRNRVLTGFTVPAGAGTGNISPTTTVLAAFQILDTADKTNSDAIAANSLNITGNGMAIVANGGNISGNTSRIGMSEGKITDIINGDETVGHAFLADRATLADGIAPGQNISPNQISPRTGSGSVVLDTMPMFSEPIISGGSIDAPTIQNGFTVSQSPPPATAPAADSGLIYYDETDKEFKVFQGGLGTPVSLVGSGGQANFSDVNVTGDVTAMDGNFNNLNVSVNADINGLLTLGPANTDVLQAINDLEDIVANGPLDASTIAGFSPSDFATAAQGLNADAANTLSLSNRDRLNVLEPVVAGHTVTLSDHATRISNNEGNIGTLQTDVGTLQTDVGALQAQIGGGAPGVGVLLDDGSTPLNGDLQLGDGTTNFRIVNLSAGTDPANAVNKGQLDVVDGKADAANVAAANAQTTADAANVAAANAQTTANTVDGKADTNAGNITTLQGNVATLQGQVGAGNFVKTDGTSVLTGSLQMGTDLASAQKIVFVKDGTDDNDAVNKSQLDAVDAKADQGIADAATAQTAADNAQITADAASLAASDAETTANDASSVAGQAQATADQAKDAANFNQQSILDHENRITTNESDIADNVTGLAAKADQTEVDANADSITGLDTRLTNAEGSISSLQNNVAISLGSISKILTSSNTSASFTSADIPNGATRAVVRGIFGVEEELDLANKKLLTDGGPSMGGSEQSIDNNPQFIASTRVSVSIVGSDIQVSRVANSPTPSFLDQRFATNSFEEVVKLEFF